MSFPWGEGPMPIATLSAPPKFKSKVKAKEKANDRERTDVATDPTARPRYMRSGRSVISSFKFFPVPGSVGVGGSTRSGTGTPQKPLPAVPVRRHTTADPSAVPASASSLSLSSSPSPSLPHSLHRSTPPSNTSSTSFTHPRLPPDIPLPPIPTRTHSSPASVQPPHTAPLSLHPIDTSLSALGLALEYDLGIGLHDVSTTMSSTPTSMPRQALPSPPIAEPTWNPARDSAQSNYSAESWGGPRTPKGAEGNGMHMGMALPLIEVDEAIADGAGTGAGAGGQGMVGGEDGLLGDGQTMWWTDMDKTPTPSTAAFEALALTPTFPKRMPSASSYSHLIPGMHRANPDVVTCTQDGVAKVSDQSVCPDDSPTLPAVTVGAISDSSDTCAGAGESMTEISYQNLDLAIPAFAGSSRLEVRDRTRSATEATDFGADGEELSSQTTDSELGEREHQGDGESSLTFRSTASSRHRRSETEDQPASIPKWHEAESTSSHDTCSAADLDTASLHSSSSGQSHAGHGSDDMLDEDKASEGGDSTTPDSSSTSTSSSIRSRSGKSSTPPAAPSIPARKSSRSRPKLSARGSSLRSTRSATSTIGGTTLAEGVASSSSTSSSFLATSGRTGTLGSTTAVRPTIPARSSARPPLQQRSRTSSLRSSSHKHSRLPSINEREAPRDLELEPDGSWALRSRSPRTRRVKRSSSQPNLRSSPCQCIWCDTATATTMPFSKQKGKQPEMDAITSNVHSFIPASAFPPSQSQSQSFSSRPTMMYQSLSYQGPSPSALPVPRSRLHPLGHPTHQGIGNIGHRGLTQAKSYGELSSAKKDSLRSSLNHAGSFLRPRGWSKQPKDGESDLGISSTTSLSKTVEASRSSGDEVVVVSARQLDREQEVAREKFRLAEQQRQREKQVAQEREKYRQEWESGNGAPALSAGVAAGVSGPRARRERTRTEGGDVATSIGTDPVAQPPVPSLAKVPMPPALHRARSSTKTLELEALLREPNDESRWPARKLEFDVVQKTGPVSILRKRGSEPTDTASTMKRDSEASVEGDQGQEVQSRSGSAALSRTASSETGAYSRPSQQAHADESHDRLSAGYNTHPPQAPAPLPAPTSRLPQQTLTMPGMTLTGRTSLEMLIQLQMQQQAQLMRLIQVQMAQSGFSSQTSLPSLPSLPPMLFAPPSTPLPPVPTPNPNARSASATRLRAESVGTPSLSISSTPGSTHQYSTPPLPTAKPSTPQTIIAPSAARQQQHKSPSSGIPLPSRIRPVKSAMALGTPKGFRAIPRSGTGAAISNIPSRTSAHRSTSSGKDTSTELSSPIISSKAVRRERTPEEKARRELAEQDKRDALLSLLNAENWDWPAPPNRCSEPALQLSPISPLSVFPPSSSSVHGDGDGDDMAVRPVSGDTTSATTITLFSSSRSKSPSSPLDSVSEGGPRGMSGMSGMSVSTSVSTIATDFGVVTPPHTSRDLAALAGTPHEHDAGEGVMSILDMQVTEERNGASPVGKGGKAGGAKMLVMETEAEAEAEEERSRRESGLFPASAAGGDDVSQENIKIERQDSLNSQQSQRQPEKAKGAEVEAGSKRRRKDMVLHLISQSLAAMAE